jgi:hypothetical protein
MARSFAAAQVPDGDSEYREIIAWYEDELQKASPPTDLEWEPVKIGPTWQYENGWVLPAVSLGWRNLAWAGLRLRNKRGQPWTYTLEQARFLLWFWALDEAGEFVFHSAVLQRLKGWGKDPVGACVSATDICSEDAAFDHWNGDVPVGRQQQNAWVQVVATAQVQTQNTMKLFPSLLPAETRLRYGVQVGKLNVYARGDEAQIEAVTSNALALEGGRPTLIIRNEPQNWIQANGGHEMAGAIEGNAAKSEDGAARMLDICNAYRPGQDSVAERTREGWESTQGDNPQSLDFGLLYDSLEAPPQAPLTAEAAPGVVESIRGDSTWLNTRRIVKSILNPSNSASESRRKWYNQITATEDARFDPNQVKACATTDALADGDEIVLFGDGSKSDDATGIVACRISDGLCQTLHVQQPKKATAGEAATIVDRDAVDHAVIEAMAAYKVVAFFFDPSHARDDDAEDDDRFFWPLCDTWHRRYGKRLKVWATKSGDRQHAVAWDMTSPARLAQFVPAVEQLDADIQSGDFRFRQAKASSTLQWHLVNARRAPGKFGVSMRKDGRESTKKIDLAVCAAGARMLRRMVLLQRKTTGSGKGRVVVVSD